MHCVEPHRIASASSVQHEQQIMSAFDSEVDLQAIVGRSISSDDGGIAAVAPAGPSGSTAPKRGRTRRQTDGDPIGDTNGAPGRKENANKRYESSPAYKAAYSASQASVLLCIV